MKHRFSFVAAAALCTAVLTGCDSTAVATQLLDDATVTNDVAASAGDAMATHVKTMVGNETSGTFAGIMGDAIPVSNAVSTSRTTACFDAAGAPVTNCQPMASVRRIVATATLSGTRTRTDTINGRVRGFTGTVSRVASDTITRNFTATTETSRAHTGLSRSTDTTTFTEGDMVRRATEVAVDTVKAVTWSMPRSAYPISGSVVRVVTGTVTLTKGTRTESRQIARKITVTFPPDAQGNVTMTVDGKTCTLNLTTHRVGNCS